MAGGAGGMGGGGMGGGMGLTIINRVVVPGPRQVLLHVKIAELNRQAMREIGVSWLDTKGRSIIGSSAGGVGGVGATAIASHSTGASNPIGLLSPVTSTFNATGTASSGGQLFGVFDAGHFSLFINALRANSLAKILAEPNLVALDGQPARFLVGGNFPYPVPQSSSIPGGTAVITIQFARFGTILNFIPQILANDVIRLDVEPVVSNLDPANGITLPGNSYGSGDRRAECAHRRRVERRTDAGNCRLDPDSRPRRPRIASPDSAICPWSDRGSATSRLRRSRPRR